MKNVLIFLLFILSFSSCGTWRFNKTSDFTKLSETNTIDGLYRNRSSGDKQSYHPAILSFFGRDTANFVSLKIEGKDKLIVSYENEKGKQERIYTGKFKKKFFEIYYHKKQFFIPFIFSSIDISRARIGKTKEGELLIRSFNDQSGNLLFLAGGSAIEKPYRFPQASFYNGLKPAKQDNKWGFADLDNNIKIPCIYDYVYLFDNGIARAKQNGKWGLIDTTGNDIIPFKYDDIAIFSDWGYTTYLNRKSGMLDNNGKELLPPVYNLIEWPNNNIAMIKLKDKWGCVTKNKVVIPAIYTRLFPYYNKYFLAERDNRKYYIDFEGYEYEYTDKDMIFYNKIKPDLSTKRKIQFEEQDITQ